MCEHFRYRMVCRWEGSALRGRTRSRPRARGVLCGLSSWVPKFMTDANSTFSVGWRQIRAGKWCPGSAQIFWTAWSNRKAEERWAGKRNLNASSKGKCLRFPSVCPGTHGALGVSERPGRCAWPASRGTGCTWLGAERLGSPRAAPGLSLEPCSLVLGPEQMLALVDVSKTTSY